MKKLSSVVVLLMVVCVVSSLTGCRKERTLADSVVTAIDDGVAMELEGDLELRETSEGLRYIVRTEDAKKLSFEYESFRYDEGYIYGLIDGEEVRVYVDGLFWAVPPSSTHVYRSL